MGTNQNIRLTRGSTGRDSVNNNATGEKKQASTYSTQIAQTALKSVGETVGVPRATTGHPEYAAAVSILFTKATNQDIILGTNPRHVLSTPILCNSLLHDKRFRQVHASDTAPGDIIIDSGGNRAGFAGIVLDHQRIVSMGTAGTLQNNDGFAEIPRICGPIEIFRFIGVQKALSHSLANAGYKSTEPRNPGGQPDGGHWTKAGVSGGVQNGQAKLQMAPSRAVTSGGNRWTGRVPRAAPAKVPKGDDTAKKLWQAAKETAEAYLNGLIGLIRPIFHPDPKSSKPKNVFQIMKDMDDEIDMTKPEGLGHAMAMGTGIAVTDALSERTVESSDPPARLPQRGSQAVINQLSSNLENGTLSEIQVRDWYNSTKVVRTAIIDKMKAAGFSDEEIAHEAFDLRNAARDKARDLMTDRDSAEDLARSNPNLTWDQALKKYNGDYQKIIQKSLESDPKINKLIEEKRAGSGIYETDK